eukprot:579618-Prymnesium_polylepis.3
MDGCALGQSQWRAQGACGNGNARMGVAIVNAAGAQQSLVEAWASEFFHSASATMQGRSKGLVALVSPLRKSFTRLSRLDCAPGTECAHVGHMGYSPDMHVALASSPPST